MPEKDYIQTEGDLAINDLYPDLSPENQQAAEYRLRRYFMVVKDIFERIALERPELLTELERLAMLRKERQK